MDSGRHVRQGVHELNIYVFRAFANLILYKADTVEEAYRLFAETENRDLEYAKKAYVDEIGFAQMKNGKLGDFLA